ncbi:MAG: type III-B CRISPR module-associated Cmr3 family protein [Bacteroides fragilis]
MPNVYPASEEQDSGNQKRKFFDHKTYNNYLFWCTQGNNQIKKLLSDEIWISKMQIGITKHVEEGEDNNKSFYKQEFLQLKKSFIYAFYITLSGESELSSDIIQLGGQRSVFRMEVESIEENSDIQEKYQTAAQFLTQSDRLLILSPTYVDNLKELSALCNFMWSDSIVFRNIQTTNASNFYGKPIKSSSKYHFLKPGSVLYFKQGKRKEVEKLLMDYTYLRLSGYNIYI